MIKLKSIQEVECSHLTDHHKIFPYFLTLPVQGKRTGSVEALSSYLCRQAECVSEWAHTYAGKLLRANIPESCLPKDSHLSSAEIHACNGVGVTADRFSRALTIASDGEIDGERLTLRPLSALTTTKSHGLSRPHQAWCSQCWKDDRDNDRTPFVRLCWTIPLTSICPIHNQKLTEVCPACGEYQHVFPTFPRQWVCNRCGTALFEDNSKHLADNFTAEEAWISHSIYRLIERTYANKYEITSDLLSRALRRLLRSHQIEPCDLALRLNVNRKMVERLARRGGRVHFPAFLDMCYRLDIPPDQFLFDRDVLSTPDHWRNLAKAKFYSTERISASKKKQIAREIKRVIKAEPEPPIRPAHFAYKHKISYSRLRYHFPNEYSVLRQRWLKWDAVYKRGTKLRRFENLCEGIFNLARHGIYPSERKLRDLKYVLPSDLRRDDVKQILAAFQDVFACMGIEAD